MIAAFALALAMQVPTFDATSEVVNLWVNVRDRSGAAVSDLRKEDFVLLQDGASVPIELFGRQGEAGDDSLYSLNLGLLFDVSASMVPAIAASRASALAFLDSVPNAQDMTVTMFDHMAQSMRYRPEDKERVRRWVEKAPAGGGSAVYAGIDHALNAMAPNGKRRVLVVLTDGLDESSALGLDALNRRLLAAGATVYVVQFRDGLSLQRRAQRAPAVGHRDGEAHRRLPAACCSSATASTRQRYLRGSVPTSCRSTSSVSRRSRASRSASCRCWCAARGPMRGIAAATTRPVRSRNERHL